MHTLDAIADRFGIEFVIRFGSTAQGRGNPESDLDLAVLRRFGRPRWTLDDLCAIDHAIWELLRPPQEIDLVDLSGASSLLLREVVTKGQVLYAADPNSFARFTSYALRRYEDDTKWRAALSARLKMELHVA